MSWLTIACWFGSRPICRIARSVRPSAPMGTGCRTLIGAPTASRTPLLSWRRPPTNPLLRLLVSAAAAVKHFAMLLGRTTHAANHHPVQELNGDGETVTRLKRDSVDAPRPVPADRSALKAAPKPKPTPKPRAVRPWQAAASNSEASWALLALSCRRAARSDAAAAQG
jgi:hypothetical protein